MSLSYPVSAQYWFTDHRPRYYQVSVAARFVIFSPSRGVTLGCILKETIPRTVVIIYIQVIINHSHFADSLIYLCSHNIPPQSAIHVCSVGSPPDNTQNGIPPFILSVAVLVPHPTTSNDHLPYSYVIHAFGNAPIA